MNGYCPKSDDRLLSNSIATPDKIDRLPLNSIATPDKIGRLRTPSIITRNIGQARSHFNYRLRPHKSRSYNFSISL